MGDIFAELSTQGFRNLEQIELFPEEKKSHAQEADINEKKYSVEELLYDKTYICPVCNKEFKAKTIRSGRNRLISIDVSLRATYDLVDPLIYECIVCSSCGYAALYKQFMHLSTSQIRWIKEKICSQYKGNTLPDIMTHNDAIIKYKLALLNAMAKKAKDGEKAYLCLKLSWLYKEVGNEEQEKNFLKYSLTGFLNAYSKERFPIFELDELTVAYIIADLYRKLEDYDKALQWVSYVILDKHVSSRLKVRALQLKGIIREAKLEEESK